MNKYELLNIIFSLGIFTWLWHGMHRVKKRTTKSFHKKTWQEPKAVIQTNLVTIFLVKDTSMKKCVKDDHLSYVTATTSNLDQKLPKCYWRRLHHFCAACFATLENIFFNVVLLLLIHSKQFMFPPSELLIPNSSLHVSPLCYYMVENYGNNFRVLLCPPHSKVLAILIVFLQLTCLGMKVMLNCPSWKALFWKFFLQRTSLRKSRV